MTMFDKEATDASHMSMYSYVQASRLIVRLPLFKYHDNINTLDAL